MKSAPLSATVCFALLLVFWALSGKTVSGGEGRRPLEQLEPVYRDSVLRGWNLFHTSFAADGVACIHCHPDHEALRSWARAYPKVEVFDGTPYEVKGFDQVVQEALEKHTDLSFSQRAELVEDLVSFLAWWSDGQEVRPGFSRPLPPAEQDLRALAASVERGGKRFASRALGPCSKCHPPDRSEPGDSKTTLAGSVLTFPRYVEEAGEVLSLPAFLSRHLSILHKGTYDPQGRIITDLSAYLTDLTRGQAYRPGGKTRVRREAGRAD